MSLDVTRDPRAKALRSWENTGTDPAARRARTEPATKARGRIAEVDQRVTELESVVAELRETVAALTAAA